LIITTNLAVIEEDDVVIFFNFRTDRVAINRSVVATRLS
jgi:bisphosphoglycerate-independent phosphoglycerate mutase (AlkP superfamily)